MESGLLRALLRRRRSTRLRRRSRPVSVLVESSLLEDEPLLRELRSARAAGRPRPSETA